MPDIYLERPPVILCQCTPPCFMPFRDAESGEWSSVGCLKPKGHEPPCGLDGPGDFTYRDPPLHQGPRIVLRQDQPGGIFRGQCPRCSAEYALGAVGLSADAVGIALNEEDGRG